MLALHQGSVVLVRQYRHPVAEVVLELPAGKVDEGEDPADTAARELEEETGLRPRAVHHLASVYASPGYSAEVIHLYLADDLEEVDRGTDQGEVVEVERIALSDLQQVVSAGSVKDAKTLLALTMLLMRQA